MSNNPICGAGLIDSAEPVIIKRAEQLAPVIRALAGEGYICVFHTGKQVISTLSDYVNSRPDFTVYYLTDADIDNQIKSLAEQMKGRLPDDECALVAVEGLGVFGVGMSPTVARSVIDAFLTGSSVVKAVDSADDHCGRMKGKVAIVTGGAQGFGKGIADRLVREGACVVVADLNVEGARSTACELARGTPDVIGWEADVGDEESTKRMVTAAVLEYGGLDIYINNAGTNTPGGLEEMELETFERICRINLTAYYLGSKYASRVMKLQHSFAPDRFADIIQINSKSGVAGSNKNFAYAGSKFGGVGLTQSLALELVSSNIKVNSICPGNFFESPLWSDPEKGMFTLYLNAGKVPGARTIDDIRRSYEEKVPMGRGCRPEDVARAVLYLIEQEYETGQAVPVTGGQIMMN